MLNMRTEIEVAIGGMTFKSLYAAFSAVHFFPKGKTPTPTQQHAIRTIAYSEHAREVTEVMKAMHDHWRPELQTKETRLQEQDRLMAWVIGEILDQNPSIASWLDSTSGLIVVQSPEYKGKSDHECFWQVCECAACSEKRALGCNRLGRMLTKIRSLRASKSVKIGKIPV